MRPAVFVLLCVLLACQEPATRVVPVTVEWMDWPAEADAGQPFRKRLVVSGLWGLDSRFQAGARAALSAVTFSPYFVVDDRPVACLDVQTTTVALVAIGIDTAGMAPGLAASTSRNYEMWGATWVYTFAAPAFAIGQPQPLPVRLFGTVTVRLGGADSTRRNAAGQAHLVHDCAGWARGRALASY